MSITLSDLTEALLRAARKADADQADALAVRGSSLSVDVLNGKLEHAERSDNIEVGLRILVGKRQACVSSSLIDPEALQDVAERAVAMAKEAPEDEYLGLADANQLATEFPDLDLCDPGEAPSPEELQAIAIRAEAAALDVSGVSTVQSSSAGFGQSQVYLSATNGFSAGYSRSDHGLSCVAITREAGQMERDYYGESRVYRNDLPTPETVGTLAGQRTVERAGARKPKTGYFPVLYDERVASTLIGHLLAASNGAMVARGSSWLMDALGENVLPESLSLDENPLRQRTAGSRPFDAEGLPCAHRSIVENGVLKGWTLDLSNARKLDMKSTASAARGTSSPPSPSVTNINLTQGDLSRDELISQMGTGLLVTSMIGSTINPNTGDYSRGASGFWVENGELQYPVNECTIAGNLREMLGSIIPANDARPYVSRVVPSLLVEGMTLAGS